MGSLIIILLTLFMMGVQGWRGGESTFLTSLWPRFDSRTCHMWVEFVVVSQPSCKGFLPDSLVFLLPQNPTLQFLFDPRISSSHPVKMRVKSIKVLLLLLLLLLLFTNFMHEQRGQCARAHLALLYRQA